MNLYKWSLMTLNNITTMSKPNSSSSRSCLSL